MSNPNCDGSGPHSGEQVRVLPTGGSSNAILCFACYRREMKFRRTCNQNPHFNDAKFKLPAWESLKVYAP